MTRRLGELSDRIAHAAGGNPLFISEMLAMAREQEDVDVPPTLKALLAARLDRLDESERRVLERGSVEGDFFFFFFFFRIVTRTASTHMSGTVF